MSFTEKFTVLNSIGKGAFGICYSGEAELVKENVTNKDFVAKKILISDLSESEVLKVRQEAELMKKIMHPNIVEYKESFFEFPYIIIVMEYCLAGDLTQLISYHKSSLSYFPEATIID